MVTTTITHPNGCELRHWRRSHPELFLTPPDRAEDAVGLAMCPDYPQGALIEYRIDHWCRETDSMKTERYVWEIVRCGWARVDEEVLWKPGSAYVRIHGADALTEFYALQIKAGLVKVHRELYLAAVQYLLDTGSQHLSAMNGEVKSLMAIGEIRPAKPRR